ncbi:hypothetical protein TI39_contig446g00006 [Zymoseptoria brevis]|uniref:Uncharacterized protein n=1 Tax=Zymoseptoria brevis TaxID=1047168 RepID=A0A0F4GKR9_9PEZI|nr:hypothetical protein TI39_contig446g00006 [Zymoseptoria brevis]
MASKLWQPIDPTKAAPVPIRRKNTIPGTWLTLTPSTTSATNITDAEAVSPTLDAQSASSSFLTNDNSTASDASSRHSSFTSAGNELRSPLKSDVQNPSRQSSFGSTGNEMRLPMKSNVQAGVHGDAAERREANVALGRKAVEG